MSASWNVFARWQEADAFPLTPALSRRERGERIPLTADTDAKALQALADFLPLPEGEGRGEGEGRVRPFRSRPFGSIA